MKLIKTNNFNYEIKNARIITLKINGLPIEEIWDNGEIRILNISNFCSIGIDTSIEHDLATIPSSYVVKKILGINQSLYTGSYNLLCSELNKSYTYLVPALYIKNKYDMNGLMLDVYFMNSFVSKSLSELILCYRYSNSSLYGELETILLEHPKYIRVYHLNGFDYFVFSIDDFREDVYKFADGKYSRLSPTLKNNIVNMFKLTRNSRVYKILNRSKDLIDEFERKYSIKITDDIDLDNRPDELEFIEEDIPMF